MKIRKLILPILMALLVLTGCTTGSPAPIVGSPRTRSPGSLFQGVADGVYSLVEDQGPRPIPVLYRAGNSRRAKHEPYEGAYIGAWLSYGACLRMFEYQAGKRHAVYVHEMNLGDNIPVTWILHCIAAQATPLFIIHPPISNEESTPAEMVIYLAQRLGAFNLPIMVAFYPADGHGMTPAEYTIMFRYARAVFLAHAPLAAFVWVATDGQATPQNPFYPGHDAVDWVGLPLLAGRGKDGEKADILSELENFYMAFQAYKPIMLLPLGISHFSRGDYTYRINEAAEGIRRVYNALQNFPRVRLIVYADGFTLSPSNPSDFSISTEESLTNAYKDAISRNHFLSALETNTHAAPRWVRSAFHGYYWEGRIYVNPRTLQDELNTPPPRQSAEINAQNFIESRHLTTLNIKTCPEQQVIFIDGLLD